MKFSLVTVLLPPHYLSLKNSIRLDYFKKKATQIKLNLIRFFQIAKSGLDDEEIVLMDDRGCPADPVFPGLTKENGTGALIGKFEAFKFSDSKWDT